MTTTPVTFGSTRQSFDTSRADATQQDFKTAFSRVNRDADTAPKAQSLIDINKTGDKGRNEIEQQLRSVSMGNDARDTAPVALFSRSSSSAPGSSTWAPPLTTRRDASSDDATKTTMDRASRSDDKRRTNDDVAPVKMHSRSNVTPVTMQNIGTIGANNGQSALFMRDDEVVSVDRLRNTLTNRFPDGNISVANMVEMFNIDEPRARNFMRHHGTAGELSINAFLRHVTRWQDEDGNLTRGSFENAIVNGASHLNVNRFEYEETKGFEFRGFKELYRRAGGDLPDETLLKIFNQLKSLDMKGSDEHLERSELKALGIMPDSAGDVEVSRILRAFDIAAFGEPASAPTPTPMRKPKPALPPAQQTTQTPVITQQPTTGNGNNQTIHLPPGNSHNALNQYGNIQNIFNGQGVPSWSINNNFDAPPAASTMNRMLPSSGNNFKNIWPCI